MSETKVTRRSRGEDAIYFAAAKNRYVGSVSLGYGPDGKRIRRKVFGKTEQEVRDRLKALHKEMEAGVKSSKTYTVREAVEDWLREGLDGTSERTRTLYEGLLGPLLDAIGARPLRVLSAGDVRTGLGKLADRYSTRSLQITRLSLERAIRHAEADYLVGRNPVIEHEDAVCRGILLPCRSGSPGTLPLLALMWWTLGMEARTMWCTATLRRRLMILGPLPSGMRMMSDVRVVRGWLCGHRAEHYDADG